jgi:DNA-binding response OmpR family regulator
MPGLDGYALARRIRADPNLAKIKLIAHSAYSDEQHVQKSQEVGFDFQVTKASEPGAIVEVLKVIEEIKNLAIKTQELAKQNMELTGQTKEMLQEVKEEVKEVKQEVKELKEEIKDFKDEHKKSNPNTMGNEPA